MAARITQELLDVLYQPTPKLRVTQDAVEVLTTSTGARGRVTQTAAEVLTTPTTAHSRCTQLVVEVLIKR